MLTFVFAVIGIVGIVGIVDVAFFKGQIGVVVAKFLGRG